MLASLVLLAVPASASAFTFAEWDLTGAPAGIATAGSPLSITLSGTGLIGQSTLGGVQAPSVAIGGGATTPTALVPGPGDGNLWFVDPGSGRIGRTDPGLPPAEFPALLGGTPSDLAAAANNTMWVVESASGEVDCVTPLGAVTARTSQLANPAAITRGGDGAMWFMDPTANKLARLVPAAWDSRRSTRSISRLGRGRSTSPAPDRQRPLHRLGRRAAASDAQRHRDPGLQAIDLGTGTPRAVHSNATGVWWVDFTDKRIGRYVAGVATEWALPRGSGMPNEFALASDGSLW